MGWNQGYTIFETTVIGAYDLGKLDKALLRVLMEPYRNTDIDSGGSQGLKSKDGLLVEEIVVKTFGGKLPKEPDFETCDDDTAEAYWENLGKAFNKITAKFGWR
jgi:hypothetical protein